MSEQDERVISLMADLLANPHTTVFADVTRGPRIVLFAGGAIHSAAYHDHAKTNWEPEGI